MLVAAPWWCLPAHGSFNEQEFWVKTTCDKCTQVKDNSGSCVAYSASGSKATSICNPTLRYLHRLMANTIFIRQES